MPTRSIARLCNLALGINVKPHTAWTGIPDLEFIIANAISPSLHSNSVDFTVAVSLLEHVPHSRDTHRGVNVSESKVIKHDVLNYP